MNPILIEVADTCITIAPRFPMHISASPNGAADGISEALVMPPITPAEVTPEPPAQHIKVLADGSRLPAGSTRTDHVAVIDNATGLMWAVESLGSLDNSDDGISQEACIKRCADLRLLGFDDWRLPTRAELAGLVDDTRHEPAIDTSLFPRVKPLWHWTSTPAVWSKASAWFVHFNYGHPFYGLRSVLGFALAVRRARLGGRST